MKRRYKLVALFGILGLMMSCSSSVKVVDAWKDVKTSNLQGKQILVVNRTDNDIVRQQLERDMVSQLNEAQLSALESYKIFPDVKSKEPMTRDMLATVRQTLKDRGIDMVILTELKQVKEYTKRTVSGSSGYYISSNPVYYWRGYARGFYRHYQTVYVDYQPTEVVEMTGKTYIVETLVYDLTLPEHQQLLSVVTTTLDNPQTLGTTSKDFSKKVIKTIVK